MSANGDTSSLSPLLTSPHGRGALIEDPVWAAYPVPRKPSNHIQVPPSTWSLLISPFRFWLIGLAWWVNERWQHAWHAKQTFNELIDILKIWLGANSWLQLMLMREKLKSIGNESGMCHLLKSLPCSKMSQGTLSIFFKVPMLCFVPGEGGGSR